MVVLAVAPCAAVKVISMWGCRMDLGPLGLAPQILPNVVSRDGVSSKSVPHSTNTDLIPKNEQDRDESKR